MTQTESIPRAEDFIAGPIPPLRRLGRLDRRTAGRMRALLIIRALFELALGALILFSPELTIEAFALVVGVFFCAIGVIRIVIGAADSEFSVGPRILNVVLGLLLIAIGAVAIRYPGFGLLATVLLVGFAWLIEGGATLALLPHRRQGRGWAIAAGIVALIAGAVLIIWPVESIFPLAIVAGVALIACGILDIAQSFSVRAIQSEGTAVG